MDDAVLSKVFGLISKLQNSEFQTLNIDNIKLVSFRHLGSKWKKNIENNNNRLRLMNQSYKLINNTLSYDDTQYGPNSYKCKIIENYMTKNFDQYMELNTTIIDVVFNDELLINQYISSPIALSDEYYIFIYLYALYPSILIKPYPIDVMINIISYQQKWIEQRIINMVDESELNDILLFIPICYVKHFKQSKLDKQFIATLCYVNVADANLEEKFPSDYERYYIITIDIEDMENNNEHYQSLKNYINSMTTSIADSQNTQDVKYIPTNIATEFGSFDRNFIKLLNLQKFNL